MTKEFSLTAAAAAACLMLTGCVSEGGGYSTYERSYYRSDSPRYVYRNDRRDWDRGRHDDRRRWDRDRRHRDWDSDDRNRRDRYERIRERQRDRNNDRDRDRDRDRGGDRPILLRPQ